MKKIFSTILTICAVHALVAQVNANFGVEAGVTSTYIRSIHFPGDEISKYPMGGGFYLGGTVHLNKEKPFSIQTGLRYASTKSLEETKFYSLPGFTAKGNVTMSYVEIPLNLTFSFAKCKKTSFFFGPQLKYALNGHRDYKFTGLPLSPVDEDLKFGKKSDEFRRFQTAYAVGLNKQITKNIAFVAAYQFGVRDIDNTSNYETKFNSLRLGLHYSVK